MQTPTECSICLSEVASDRSVLPCGHSFHSECIGEWFKHKESCPNCRYWEPSEDDKIPPFTVNDALVLTAVMLTAFVVIVSTTNFIIPWMQDNQIYPFNSRDDIEDEISRAIVNIQSEIQKASDRLMEFEVGFETAVNIIVELRGTRITHNQSVARNLMEEAAFDRSVRMRYETLMTNKLSTCPWKNRDRNPKPKFFYFLSHDADVIVRMLLRLGCFGAAALLLFVVHTRLIGAI